MRTAALMVTAVVTAAAQTSVVEGRVVSRVGNEPVRRASVSLRRSGQALTVETNSNGLFRVDGLTAGMYTISVQRTGYLPGGGREFDIGASARISGIEVMLTPAAVITGRVLDSDADPVSGATVGLMNYGYVSGRRQLKPVRTTMSDDRGRYRFFDLPPGRYFVQASRQGGPQGMLAAFHPSAAGAEEASSVQAASGVEARGIDVVMRSRGLYTARIRATDSGRPLLQPVPRRAGDPMVLLSVWSRGLDASRSFAIRWKGEVMEVEALPPGRYDFTASVIDSGNRRSVRRSFEVVAGDVDLVVALLPPVEVAGRVVGPEDASAVAIRLDVTDTDPRNSIVSATRAEKDGKFRLLVPPDRYGARVVVPDGFYLKAIRQGDKPLSGQTVDLSGRPAPLEIVLSEDGGEVAGVVLDTDERPARLGQVALEPVAADWPDRVKLVRADMGGNFRIHDVAPGEYRVLAWVGEEPDESRAIPLRVEAEGDHRITLRVP